jgi:hypothetical protein
MGIFFSTNIFYKERSIEREKEESDRVESGILRRTLE